MAGPNAACLHERTEASFDSSTRTSPFVSESCVLIGRPAISTPRMRMRLRSWPACRSAHPPSVALSRGPATDLGALAPRPPDAGAADRGSSPRRGPRSCGGRLVMLALARSGSSHLHRGVCARAHPAAGFRFGGGHHMPGRHTQQGRWLHLPAATVRRRQVAPPIRPHSLSPAPRSGLPAVPGSPPSAGAARSPQRRTRTASASASVRPWTRCRHGGRSPQHVTWVAHVCRRRRIQRRLCIGGGSVSKRRNCCFSLPKIAPFRLDRLSSKSGRSLSKFARFSFKSWTLGRF